MQKTLFLLVVRSNNISILHRFPFSLSDMPAEQAIYFANVFSLLLRSLKSQNRRFSRTNLLCSTAILKRNVISQFWFQKIKWHEILCIAIFGEIRSSSSRVYAVKKTIQLKLTYHAQYLGISWTDLYLLYCRFGRSRYSFGGCLRDVAMEQPLLFALAFDNGSDDNEATFKRLNGNNVATLCTNVVNFRPMMS